MNLFLNQFLNPRYQFSKNRTTFWVESSHQNRSNPSNRRESHGNQSRGNKSDANESSNNATNNRNQTKSKKPNRKSKGNSNQMEVD